MQGPGPRCEIHTQIHVYVYIHDHTHIYINTYSRFWASTRDTTALNASRTVSVKTKEAGEWTPVSAYPVSAARCPKPYLNPKP